MPVEGLRGRWGRKSCDAAVIESLGRSYIAIEKKSGGLAVVCGKAGVTVEDVQKYEMR